MTEYFKRIETNNPDRNTFLQADLVVDRNTKIVTFDNTKFINENYAVDEKDYENLETQIDILESKLQKRRDYEYEIDILKDTVNELGEEIKENDKLISNLQIVLDKTPKWLQCYYSSDNRFIEEINKHLANENDIKKFVCDLAKRLNTVYNMLENF